MAELTTATIDIVMGEGVAKGFLALPPEVSGSLPGIVLYMDAFGPRPALYGMAERIAAEGYAVLVPDLYYRLGAYGPFEAATAFKHDETARLLRGMIGATSQAMTEADTAFFIAALQEAGAKGPIGVVGYCMGGARALTAAAAYPERIAAAASFHGGNLASEAADSPHLRADQIKARVYVGTAGIDGSFPPEQSTRFVEAFRRAEVDFTLENYVGAAHGWCVPDHSVYNEKASERHWQRLLTLFAETLKS